MRYDKEMQIVRQELARLIQKTGKTGASMSKLKYELSLKYPCSPVMIQKQIELMQEVGVVEITKEGAVYWLEPMSTK